MYINNKKIDIGWLDGTGPDYMPNLVEAFKHQIKRQNQNNEEEEAQVQLVDENLIKSLCLSNQQRKEELVIQKKSGITGSYLERIGKFDKNILQQIKDKKIVKQFSPYTKVGLELKLQDSKNWYQKGGDMARIMLEFNNHTPVFVYMKDRNQGLKWQRYLIIEKLLQQKTKQVAKCFEYCQQEYQERYQLHWSFQFEQYLKKYTMVLNVSKKQNAFLDRNFLINTDKTVLSYHIHKWKSKSLKALKDEEIMNEQLKKMTLQEQEELKSKQAFLESQRAEREKRRREKIKDINKFFINKEEEIQKFYNYWKDRAIHFKSNNPSKFNISFRCMHVESNIQLVRPHLEVKFVSERTINTKDFEPEKIINGYTYKIENNPYYKTQILATMDSSRRRNFNTWKFKEGLIGLCGPSQISIEKLGYADYIELQIVDSIKISTQSSLLKFQLQDISFYTKEGRTCWFQIFFNQSKIYIEVDIDEITNTDPLFYDKLEFVQLNNILRKIVMKIIQARTTSPIVETLYYTLEPERYQAEIQEMYQRMYVENISLQFPMDPGYWLQLLETQENIVNPISQLLNNKLKQDVGTDKIKLYYTLRKLPIQDTTLTIKIGDCYEQSQSELAYCVNNIMNTFIVYYELRQIKVNEEFIPILFQIAMKLVVLIHYHFIKPQSSIFAQQSEQEPIAFWLFVSFIQLLNSLNYPISKPDPKFAPQENIIKYLEVLGKDYIFHFKAHDIQFENVFKIILENIFTNIVQSMPLYNILDLIIRKKNPQAHQIILIVVIEELGDKLLLTTNQEDLLNSIKLQVQLMDIQQILAAYNNCEANLSKIITASEVIVDKVLDQGGDQNVMSKD